MENAVAQEFAGKSVLVTGAASGLGRATALAFARAGGDLTLVDVNAFALEGAAAEARDLGAKVEALAMDLSDVSNCPQAVQAAVARFGRLDALLNVAGVIVFNRLAKVTPQEWDRVMAINLKAPYFLIQAAMPHLIEAEGAVVNVASASAFIGHAFLTPYATSKGALVSLTRSLAMEFMHAPVRINALAPGGVATPMALSSSMPEGLDFSLVARYAGLRGLSQPEDLTDLLLFLASSRNKAVHGACFIADQGTTAG